MNTPLKYGAAVLLILLLAAAARINHTASRPAWTDEGWAAWAASDHDATAILDKLREDRHPPLYYLVLSGWWSVAGPERVALRFPSVAAGLLAVAVIYRIGADWLGRRAATYAALLFAVLETAVYYTQEIRVYSWLVLAVALTTLFFLRLIRRPRLITGIAYALSVAFMFYTVYLGALVLAVQGVVGLALAGRRARRALIASWIGAALLFLPWLVVVITEQWNYLDEGIGGFPGSYTTTLDHLVPVLRLVLGSELALTGGLAALGAWTLGTRIRRNLSSPLNAAALYLLLAGIGLFAFMFVANLRFGLISARTLVMLTPFMTLTAGAGLAQIDRRAGLVLAGVFVIVTLATPQVIQIRLNSDRIAQAVAAEYSPGDLVILETGWDDNAMLYELSLALPDSARIVRTLPWINHRYEPQPVIPPIEALLPPYRRVWVVQWLQPPQVLDYLDTGAAGFRRVLERQVPAGEGYNEMHPDHPTIRAVLFERPNFEAPPLVYGDKVALHDVILPASIAAGDRLHVDLWWSALEPLPLDYSVGVFLMDADGAVRAEHNGPPGALPTTQWAADDLVFDRHTLAVPGDLPPGEYSIAANLYWYGDTLPLPINGEDYAVVGRVRISSD